VPMKEDGMYDVVGVFFCVQATIGL